jgi:hypothetical protein
MRVLKVNNPRNITGEDVNIILTEKEFGHLLDRFNLKKLNHQTKEIHVQCYFCEKHLHKYSYPEGSCNNCPFYVYAGRFSCFKLINSIYPRIHVDSYFRINSVYIPNEKIKNIIKELRKTIIKKSIKIRRRTDIK